ncbi:sigma-54-dependent Fis family transcriptional regulator [Candidatus Poribacteria bacterium]|nr:MAG: sigma-54-dependent Fis family transcriptional regulator [Candidatus Poribacteria bacterium]
MSDQSCRLNRPVQILIVDDIPANLRILRDALEPEGYNILVAFNGEDALKIARGASPDIILLDVLMPGMDGYEVCRRLKEDPSTRNIPVIFVTVRDDKEGILEGFRAGGVDYITKPFEKEEVLMRVKTHLQIKLLTEMLAERNRELERQAEELKRINRQLQEEIARRRQVETERDRAEARLSLISQREAKRWGIESFIGRSRTIAAILDDIRKLQNAGKTNVLIVGESGTGKELVARAIHFGGSRADKPFITVNCSAIPRELAESIFFGHVKGAFTGASSNRKGYFELADGGTLFLDEIGDMPLELQPKILRAIETGTIMPVGSAREKRVDVRIIAATNQDLEAKIADGTFRKDLYFRLAGFVVTVPPLRERREDIPLLVDHFLRMFAAEMGIKCPSISPEAMEALMSYDFPGNVRELKNIIEHALIKSGGSTILPEHLRFISIACDRTSQNPELGSSEKERIEELVVKRSKGYSKGNGKTYEERILEYVREHGSISNAECRDLLSIDMHHASYLLKKLHKYGLLKREGERRWARYRLP